MVINYLHRLSGNPKSVEVFAISYKDINTDPWQERTTCRYVRHLLPHPTLLFRLHNPCAYAFYPCIGLVRHCTFVLSITTN
jgi:hypothetical protein